MDTISRTRKKLRTKFYEPRTKVLWRNFSLQNFVRTFLWLKSNVGISNFPHENLTLLIDQCWEICRRNVRMAGLSCTTQNFVSSRKTFVRGFGPQIRKSYRLRTKQIRKIKFSYRLVTRNQNLVRGFWTFVRRCNFSLREIGLVREFFRTKS
jgi:hypothetical protein